MTRKEQNKILDDKIKSNINQYKVDRLNAEISAFLSGDLNKYKFLTRKDLKYKPNALDKARFNFSPLGKAFSVGLDKTSQGYQEEGAIKLLKDIRDSLADGVNRRPDDNRPDDDGFDDDDDSFDTTPYDTPHTSDDDDIKNNFKKYDNLLLKHFQLRKNMKETKDELDKTKYELDKTKDDISEKSYDSHNFYNPNGFDINGIHKDTDDIYDPNGFDIDGKHIYTKNKYDPNGFDINGKHKDTKNKYDPNGFNINGKHKVTKNKYDPNGLDIDGKHIDR